MLFDLRGRRRRAVQATYLTLAVLMGGGLVLFGIGGDVSGGLVDAFRGSGGDDGNDAIEQRIERNENRLATRPGNEAALKQLVRDHYALAAQQLPQGTAQFPAGARDELREAGSYWQRYLEAEDGDPDASLAGLAIQVYDVGALNRPAEAQRAAQIVADRTEDYQSYLQVVAYAGLAGDERTADLAAQRAVALAPRALRRQVRRQAEQLKKPVQRQQTQGG